MIWSYHNYNLFYHGHGQERVLFVIVLYLMLLTPLSFTGLEYFVKFYSVLKGILTYLNLSHLYSTHVER